MTKKLDILLHSDYPQEACLGKLAEQIDIDQWTVFSLSGYKGRGPILGRITGNEFRLHKRRYWHNSFAPVLFGRVQADRRGALVEAYWDMWPRVRFFIRVWLVLVAVIGAPIFFTTLQRAMRGGFSQGGDLWIDLIVPPALLLWGVLLPHLGAALGFHERRHVVAFMERTLMVGPSSHASGERNWKSVFDSPWAA